MPRIRTIKPDAYTSESLSEVPRGTRWTFAGLWTCADDDGRARDDVRLIKAALYPLDDTVTLEDVETDLWLLAGIGAICRYAGPDGRRYLHMPKWDEHQRINRPTASKTPPCPHEDSGTCHLPSDDDSVRNHGALTEDSRPERKGREGNGTGKGGDLLRDKSREGDDLPGFEEFWDTYDKKRDRKKCETAYRNALKKPSVTPDLLVAAAGAYITWQTSEGKHPTYTKDPLTWLHGENWADERPGRRPEPQTNVQAHLALVQQLEAQERGDIGFPMLGGV